MRGIVGIDPDDIATRAYIAGLIDGEGFVGIKRRMPTDRNKMTSPRYSVVVSIQMTDAAAVRFVAQFCGMERIVRRVLRRPGVWKPIHSFEIEQERAIILLRQVAPFLITKRRRAEICMRLWKLLASAKDNRTKIVGTYRFRGGRMRGHPYRVFALNDRYLRACDGLYQASVRDADKRGGRACAAL